MTHRFILGKTFKYSKGDGYVTVEHNRSGGERVDIVFFRNITTSELGFRQGRSEFGESRDDLVIECGSGDALRIKNIFSNANYAFDEFHLATSPGGWYDMGDVYKMVSRFSPGYDSPLRKNTKDELEGLNEYIAANI